jgi:hypothetical protein
VLQIDANIDLGQVLAKIGREGADAAFERARRLATDKGSDVLVGRVAELSGVAAS